MVRLFTLLALLSVGGAAAAEVVIREFRGMGGTDTAVFSASSPWLVEWRSRPPTAIDTDPAHLVVLLYEVNTNEFLGRVAEHSGVGRGEMLIERGGRFRFRVQGQATEWQLKVIQIDSEFAERLKEARREKDAQQRRR